jgi:hypothetical protein
MNVHFCCEAAAMLWSKAAALFVLVPAARPTETNVVGQSKRLLPSSQSKS